MSKYSKFEVDKVKRDADIRRLIPEASEHKATQDIECPFCGKAKKFRVTHRGGYNNAKCFSCEQGFANPLEAYAHYHGLDVKRDFLQVLEGCAQECNVYITPEETIRKETVRKAKEKISTTFCAQQLAGSGLTIEDIFANVIENGQELTKPTFMPGTIGQGFLPDPKGVSNI